MDFCRLRLEVLRIPRQVESRSKLAKSLAGNYLRRVLVEEERARLRDVPGPVGP